MGYFINEIENIFFRVPIRYRNNGGLGGELEIAWKHSPWWLESLLQFLVLPNFHYVSILDGNGENVFYFLNFTYIFKIFVLVISYREATKSSIGGCD